MPTFEFTSPEGKKYRIQGPDGATKEQAFGILQQQLGAAPAADAPNPQMAGVPGYDGQGRPETARAPVKEERPINGVDIALGSKGTAGDVFDKVLGVVETPIAVASGIAGGLAGAWTSVGKAAAKKITTGKSTSNAEMNATVENVANAITYQPRTKTGRDGVELVGKIAAPLEGLAGVSPTDMLMAGRAVSTSARSLRDLASNTNAVQNAADAAAVAGAGGARLRDLVRAPNQMSGVGAAEASQATTRATRAQSLPVPVKLTRGQLTRDRTQVAFERETAKQKEGAPLAAHYEDQNATFLQNLDEGLDQTGAQNITPRSVGKSFVAAVEGKSKAKLAEVNGLYRQAREAGEMQAPVDVSGLVDWIAKNKGKDKLAPIISTIENELKQNAKTTGGGADPLTLAQRPRQTVMTLEASEDLRQAINKLAEPGTPNVVFGKDAKALIDAAQEGKGGDLFKQARRAYENYANEFTNRDVIDKALRTKPGTKDRAVAYEDIFNHSILNGSTDDVRHVFRVLEAHPTGAAPEVVAAGQQAAKDLRGAVINHIKDEMQKNLNVDSTGVRTGSPAKIDAIVRELDKDGKLDVIFGKKGAEQVRDLRDVAIDIYTSPTGTVNSSNTASALMRKLDDVAGYAKGTPIIGKAVNYTVQAVKSANTRRKVREAINPNLSDLSGKGK